MTSGENTVWLPEYGLLDIDGIGEFAGEFQAGGEAGFCSKLNDVPEISFKPDTSSGCGSKASREKKRRDKLNDRFMELGFLLDPGKKSRTDKATLLSDAIHVVNELQSESKKLQEENGQLEEIIKELKAEKNELREEKMKLKADKERLEKQMKEMTIPMSFLPHPATLHAAFSPQVQVSGTKPDPFMSYGGVPMWQFLPPGLVDSSKDSAGVPPGA